MVQVWAPPYRFENDKKTVEINHTSIAADRPLNAALCFVSEMEDCAVIIEGWHPGFKKVKAAKLLQNFAGYNLAAAKSAVDDVLEKKSVFVHFCTREEACEFQEKIVELGANAQVID